MRALDLLVLELLQAGKRSGHGGPWTVQAAVRPL